MPLVWPYPFPNENARDPVETFRLARNMWLRAQKFRAGQFSWTQLITAMTTARVTFTDVSVGGTDTGFDNLAAGMFVEVSPPATLPAGIAIDCALVAATGTLTMQIRNGTAGDITVSGTWSYFGYAY